MNRAVEWHFYTSPVTGLRGPSDGQPVLDGLKAIHLNPVSVSQALGWGIARAEKAGQDLHKTFGNNVNCVKKCATNDRTEGDVLLLPRLRHLPDLGFGQVKSMRILVVREVT
ncbi:hypothetical protein K9B32_13505 [Rhizobium sp. 3T7]|uniref:hypothetical protein n=1 Tax=Rhizobium sp. 3T7 TaxID=2874922 RepID=UPI001CCC7D52|nr:hypothetical protein [Rhizobium sp. 3T7]MBZ9791129.1 hypothetical protein [Rhizobium sp. 3T7]